MIFDGVLGIDFSNAHKEQSQRTSKLKPTCPIGDATNYTFIEGRCRIFYERVVTDSGKAIR
jgi:hypothetical protein